jgi:sporulation protein YlmC with PRC-barrel domain
VSTGSPPASSRSRTVADVALRTNERCIVTKTISAVALALALGAAPLAVAQTPHYDSAGLAEEVIQPNQMRASKMIGSAVYDVQNRKIGKVRDLVLDRGGQIAVVVVDVGSFLGMGGKNVAVKPSDLKTDNNRLTLDVTKEQLQQMANYRLEDRSTGAGSSPSPVKGGKLGSGH